jgi:hypothetical protein
LYVKGYEIFGPGPMLTKPAVFSRSQHKQRRRLEFI